MYTQLHDNGVFSAVVATVLLFALLSLSFLLFEPSITQGATRTFTISQDVTSEIAFVTDPNDVTMTPSLSGLTGGSAFGTSTVAINTNNPAGYNMTIQFSTTTAMQGDGISSEIGNYGPASAGTPDYNWSVGANTGEFGYTVNGVTNPTDVDTRFQNTGSTCNSAGSADTNHCWYNVADATSPVTIINRSSATPGTGATSTIVFQVGITQNPSPAIQTGTYIATATLTAITN